MKGVKEWEFFVAGTKFHGLDTVIDQMLEDEELILEPEPTNQFDPNAVKIKYNEVMIGYVPKKLAKEVTHHLNHGGECTAKTSEVNPDAESWKQLRVLVTGF